MGVTHDQWLSELEKLAVTGGPDGLSTREIAEALGMSARCVRDLLRAGIAAGKVAAAGWRAERSIDGRMLRIPVYRVEFKMPRQRKPARRRAGK